jgi:hypothetical protein
VAEEIGERVARLEAQMEPLLKVPEALGRLEGKVDQILNGRGGNAMVGTIFVRVLLPLGALIFGAIATVVLAQVFR